MDYITLHTRPELRTPTLIAAFEGWNDAAYAATTAAHVLCQRWRARAFADIEPEEFYAFTETRPRVRPAGRTQRRIEWPANTFFYTQVPEHPRDYVVLIGIEPQLRWKAFGGTIIGMCRELHISTMVTLGALLDSVPHTHLPRISGSSNDPAWLDQLRQFGLDGSRYQGPTGIVGVLSVLAGEHGLRTASLWGHVPHYLQGMRNPRVALALLQRLSRVLDVPLDLRELEHVARQFDSQVAEAVAQNPEAAEYVHRLEAGLAAGGTAGAAADEGPEGELPSGEALVQDLEEFLRRRHRPGGGRSADG